MADMRAFCMWFLQTMPAVLLEPPISAFVGMALLCVIVRVIWRMCHP